MAQTLHVTEKGHQIVLGGNGHIYCSCPAWRFQKLAPTLRTCKHLKEFAATVANPAAAKKIA